ncbi:hypothetical protein F5879DRAFT_505942 [Lentinula edodes]|nr:hypothetical protein F5879DRAFT_505942 [Lentinula edodes]
MEVQEPFPRAQSVMQTRSSGFHSKANRIFNKVSNFKVRLLGNSRTVDSTNDRGKGPYMSMNMPTTFTRETRSMDLNLHVAQKPYMSQPVLDIRKRFDNEDHDEGDSTASSAQSMHQPSPSRTDFVKPENLRQQQGKVDGLPNVNEASQTTSFNSGLPNSNSSTVRIKQRYQARLEGSTDSSLSQSNRQVERQGKQQQERSSIEAQRNEVTDSSSFNKSRRNPELPNTSGSTLSISSSATVTPLSMNSSEKPLPVLIASPKHPNSSQPLLSSHSPITSPTSTSIISPLDSSQNKPSPITSPSSQRPTTSPNTPPTTFISSSYPSRRPSAPHLNTAIFTTSSSRRPSAPHLNTPLPGQRFNLLTSDNESASARLSPSIIIRQPALPILNLPKLNLSHATTEADDGNLGPLHSRISASEGTGVAGSSAFARRMSGMASGSNGSPVVESRRISVHAQSRRNLREMPALPMAGKDQRDNEDDHEDVDGDADSSDDDEDTDVDVEGDGEAEDDDTRSSTESQFHTLPLPPPPPTLPSVLPPVNLTKIDFSFLNFDPKGKQRANDDSGKTPTASLQTPRFGSHNDYFSAQHYGSSGSGENSNPNSSNGTPRIHSPVPGKTPSAIPARTPKASEFTVNRTPLPVRPGIYQHASRSMIDIPGLGVGSAETKLIKEDKHAEANINVADSLTPDGVLDHVGGIKRHEAQPEVELGTAKASSSTTSTTASINATSVHSLLDDVTSEPSIATTQTGPVMEKTRKPLSSRKDASLITEEPRDPHARKDTLALGPSPHLSMEEHLAHIQAPARLPPPSNSTETTAAARNGRPSSTGSLLRRRSMPTFNVRFRLRIHLLNMSVLPRHHMQKRVTSVYPRTRTIFSCAPSCLAKSSLSVLACKLKTESGGKLFANSKARYSVCIDVHRNLLEQAKLLIGGSARSVLVI